VTNAKVTRSGTIGTIASITVGDGVLVQGSVNGTSIAATSVIDQGAAPTAQANTSVNGAINTHPAHRGFFGSIGGFFGHLFGFF